VSANVNSGSTGTITASGGTLDLTGTVNSGPSLTIDSTTPSVLKIDGTATAATAIAISSSNQTLEIGVTAVLTVSATESITNGTIQLDGGIYTAPTGLPFVLDIHSGATLTGFGSVRTGNILIGTSGTATVSGGNLSSNGYFYNSGAVTVANGDTLMTTASGSDIENDTGGGRSH